MLGERSFERVGGNLPIQTDVRLIAATNKNLETLVALGKFRDRPLLPFERGAIELSRSADPQRRTFRFLSGPSGKESAKENGKPVTDMTSEAMNALLAHDWPGNVRELRAAVEHGVVMTSSAKITLRDLPQSVRQRSRPCLPNLSQCGA